MNDLIDKKEGSLDKADTLKSQADVSPVIPERRDNKAMAVTDHGSVGCGKDSVTSDNPNVTFDNPHVISNNPNVISDNADVNSHNADVISGNPKVISNKTEVTSESPEVVSNNPEVICLKAEVISGKADVVIGKPNVISSHTEVIPGKANVSSGSASANFTQISSNSVQISSSSAQTSSSSAGAPSSSAHTSAASAWASAAPERPAGSGGLSFNVSERVGLGSLNIRRIRPKAPQADLESKSSKQAAGGSQVNETDQQRHLEFLEKYEKIRRTIPRDKRNNLSSLMKFKGLLLEYPEFTFPGAWRLRLRRDPEGIYRDTLINRLKEELRDNLGKRVYHDSMPWSMAKVLMQIMNLRLTERSKLVDLLSMNERTFIRAVKLLKGLDFVKKIRMGNIHYVAITEKGKTFMKSIGVPGR